jgi:hypothetical protein
MFSVLLALTAGCAADVGPDVGSADAPLAGADRVPAEVYQALARAHEGDLSDAELDQVYELHHFVRIDATRRVHVTETFTLRSWLTWPHRGVLLLPGTLSLGSFYNLDVDGYRFQDTLAQNGYFAFSVDYEGSGGSTYPANGYDVTHDFLVSENRRVVRFVRILRLIPRLDVLGESNGGSVAAELCDDARAIRSCVMSSMLYAEGTPFFNAVFLDPGFVWFLSNQPEGYMNVGPELYFNIASRMSPEVQAATLSTQPGRYAMGPLVAPVGGIPWFDPRRSAGLIIQGTEDNVATQNDADLLADAYGETGGGGGVVRIGRRDDRAPS